MGQCMHIVCGPPGVGKSFVARVIGEKSGGTVLSTEQIRDECSGDVTPNSDRIQTYRELYRQASEQLADGQDVILDGEFRTENHRSEAAVIGCGRDVSVHFVRVRCRGDIARERLRKRDGLSKAGVDVYEQIKNEFEPLTRVHSSIDNSGFKRETKREVGRLPGI